MVITKDTDLLFLIYLLLYVFHSLFAGLNLVCVFTMMRFLCLYFKSVNVRQIKKPSA